MDELITDFETALANLKKGIRVARKGWNGKGMWIMLCIPDGDYTILKDEKTYGRLPYIYMKTADEKLVPWNASQIDVLADDWYFID